MFSFLQILIVYINSSVFYETILSINMSMFLVSSKIFNEGINRIFSNKVKLQTKKKTFYINNEMLQHHLYDEWHKSAVNCLER